MFGKNKMLIDLLETALQNPEGTIKDTLFPVVKPQILEDIVKELKYKSLCINKSSLENPEFLQ